MSTTSALRGFTVPTVAGDVGIWGGELNTTIGGLDTILGQSIVLPSSTYGTAATLSSSQAQTARVVVSNTGASPFQLNLNSSNFALGNFIVTNLSSQGQGLTVTAGSSGTGGTSVSILANTSRFVNNDGTNITFGDSQFPLQAGFAFSFDGGTAAPSSGVKPGFQLPFTFQAQTWALGAFDAVGSMSVDVQQNLITVSTHNTPTLSSTMAASGSCSGWSVTQFTSGNFINPIVNSASSATKFSLTLEGVRLT